VSRTVATSGRRAGHGTALVVLAIALAIGVAAGRVYANRTPDLSRFDADIEWAAGKARIDADLLRAVVASESGGDPHARSRVGAIGLCQLMPKTAKALADDLGMTGVFPKQLYAPRINLRLGAEYLRRMLERHDGSEALALAAYNAGGRHVRRWRRRAPDASPRAVVEREGYPETRGFVGRVLRLSRAYRER